MAGENRHRNQKKRQDEIYLFYISCHPAVTTFRIRPRCHQAHGAVFCVCVRIVFFFFQASIAEINYNRAGNNRTGIINTGCSLWGFEVLTRWMPRRSPMTDAMIPTCLIDLRIKRNQLRLRVPSMEEQLNEVTSVRVRDRVYFTASLHAHTTFEFIFICHREGGRGRGGR